MPLRLVDSIEQVVENARCFDKYRQAPAESEERNFWEKKMKSGRSFLRLIGQSGDIFCPSMFAGYVDNTLVLYNQHRRDMDGRDTNRQINRLLEKHREDENSKIALRSTFERHGLTGGWPEPWFWVLEENEESAMIEQPLNRIFYGPPGTGKTYHTVSAALEILDPGHPRSQARFEELIKEGRIEFVTFHQSFSYEEFVEGLKATTDDSGQISYEVQDGVFKRFCDRARAGKAYFSVEQAIEKFQEECSENPIKMQTIHRNSDIEVLYRGKNTFRVNPLEGKSDDNPVNIESIKKVMLGANAKDFHFPSYIKAISKHIKDKYISKDESNGEQKSHVLIIDEINRGNISRIFGELITLIEPSKRAGAEDALSVTLPYSGESFSVPKNLYIIGTMNTADRSIALLDTALRRRFRFEEMMPDLTLLDGVVVKGIEIRKLLSTMNERIEALYDRDHQIGHAYFLPLKGDATLEKLSDIFRHSILPLLQEYFYDDWEKIDMVLGGRKEFLKSSNPSTGLGLDDEKKLWRIDKNAFDDAENYRKIYGG